MDLYKCAKIPLYVSLPHFYDSHESYLKGVKGLKPDVEKHGIRIMFESVSYLKFADKIDCLKTVMNLPFYLMVAA